jgi:hypothetical protein
MAGTPALETSVSTGQWRLPPCRAPRDARDLRRCRGSREPHRALGKRLGHRLVVALALRHQRDAPARAVQRLRDPEADPCCPPVISAVPVMPRPPHRQRPSRSPRPPASAWAAMVSDGFTAAEVGKTLASAIQRLAWSCARPQGVATLLAGSVPIRAVPHWCDGVRDRTPSTGSPDTRPAAARLSVSPPAPHAPPSSSASSSARCPPLQRDAAIGVWQVLGHDVEVDGMVRDEVRQDPGKPRLRREDRTGTRPRSCTLPSGSPFGPPGRIPVVQIERLLIDRPVAPRGQAPEAPNSCGS